MTKLYIPEIGDKLRLTAPLHLLSHELNMGYGVVNRQSFFRVACPDEAWNWQKADHIKSIDLEIGTVLAFRRYFVSVHAKTNDVEVSIFAAPRRDLTPRKQGGTSTMVKFVLPLAVLNRIEYERLEI